MKNAFGITPYILFLHLFMMHASSYGQGWDEEVDDEAALLGLYGDELTISIATGEKQAIAKAPAVATVITSDTIELMGAADLDEVLETVPGLHVGRSNIGYNPIYTFRGIYSSFNPQVLMLINGVPLTNLHLGNRGQSWGGMPVSSIARIEVIRGPGSAVFGADAFAGVINIITKTKQDIPETRLSVRSGSFNTREAAFMAGKSWKDIDVAFIAEYYKTDGHEGDIVVDAQTGLDFVFGTNASHAPGPVSLSRENVDLRLDLNKDKWRLRSGLQRRRDWGSGAGVGEALDPTSRYKSDRFNVDLTWSDPEYRKYWDVTAQISYLDTTNEVEEDLVIFPPGVTVLGLSGVANIADGNYTEGIIGNPEVFERHYRANLSAFYTGFVRHKLRIGAGYYFGDVYKVSETKNFGIDPNDPTGDTLLPAGGPIVDVSDTAAIFLREDDRENYYFFLQDIWKLADDWELTAGVRYDDYSDFGTTTNPRLALVWSTLHNLTTKFLYGRAFRAPSFGETRAINNPVALGNPDLEPETIESFEVAFDYSYTEATNFRLNLFYYSWEDIIEFITNESTSSAARIADNAGEQDGRGFEIEARWKLSPSFSVSTNYSFVNTKENNFDTPNIPRQQIYINTLWEIDEHFHFWTQLNHVMDRRRLSQDTREDINDDTLVDATFRYFLPNKKLSLSVSIRNIFDEEAREPSLWSNPAPSIPNDLPLAGRNFHLGAEYSF